MSKILVADIEIGAVRLRNILSGRHELTFAKNIGEVLELGDKEKFDLVIVGVHFDNSRMFDLISAAKKTPLARIPFVGFAEKHTDLAVSSRESIEGIVYVLGGADYIDTQGMNDNEILERIELSITNGTALNTASRSNDGLKSKRMAQDIRRWTKMLNESSPRTIHKVLLVSTEEELVDKIEQSVKNFSGVTVKVDAKPTLSEGLVLLTSERHSALVCDLDNLLTSDSRNAVSLFAEQIPVIALTNASQVVNDANSIESSADIIFVNKSHLGIELALAVLSAINKTQSPETPDNKFSRFYLSQLRAGLKAIDAHESLQKVLHDFCSNMEVFGRKQSNDDLFITILLRDENGATLRSGAAPSIPEEYSRAVDNLPIGPECGACGTAAYSSRPVYVTDIDTDPKWAKWLEVTQPHGLKACWSVPILDNDFVLATFGIYYKTRREPQDSELRLVGAAAEILKTILLYARKKQYSLSVH